MRKILFSFIMIAMAFMPAIAKGAEITVIGQATGRGDAFVKTEKNWILVQESFAQPVTEGISLMTEDGMLSIALNGGVRIEIKPDTEAKIEMRGDAPHITVLEGQAVINIPEGSMATASAGRVNFEMASEKSAYANNDVVAAVMIDGPDVQAAAVFGSFKATSDNGTTLHEFKPGEMMAFVGGRSGALQARKIQAVGEDASDRGPAALTLGTSLAAIALVLVAF